MNAALLRVLLFLVTPSQEQAQEVPVGRQMRRMRQADGKGRGWLQHVPSWLPQKSDDAKGLGAGLRPQAGSASTPLELRYEPSTVRVRP